MVSKIRVVPVLACFLLAALPLAEARDEPDRVLVQHILIAYKKSVPGKEIERSRKEARALAMHLLDRARNGDDFDALVQEYTDDKYPGKILIMNKGVNRVPGAMTRNQLAAKFGDVAFRLEVGEIDMASHHAALSPYGWHVIKRLE